MEWRDVGALLNVRKHGEGSAIIEVFTREHGRHAGIVRGGGSRKMAPILQPGAQLSVEWKARLEEHLGAFTVDPIKSRAASIMSDRGALAAMGAISALLTVCLAEREVHEALYLRTENLLDALGEEPDWAARYALWELALLRDAGFGLDFSECAATGVTQDLIYISPKSGRAVSRDGGKDWADRLLPLPRFLRLDDPVVDPDQVREALRTTGYFIENWLMPELGKQVPDTRERLVTQLSKVAT